MEPTDRLASDQPAGKGAVFPIGITMAGAASAGCYTAGVMDYLFEILQIWEDAKKGNGQLPAGWDPAWLEWVPNHRVQIDVMGGTSAGGMTAVMSAIYALNGIVKPVTEPAPPLKKGDNLLYDSWVLMGDEPQQPALLEKTLDQSDLKRSGKVQSLLNSDFIDVICDNAFVKPGTTGRRLPFVAPDLELILSHTMLRSLPLGVNFNTPAGMIRRRFRDVDHFSFEHFTVSHFRLQYLPERDQDRYLPLQPFDPVAAKTMKLATKATGAFPVGLKFREFFDNELSAAYLKNRTAKIALNRLSDLPANEVPELEFPGGFPDQFSFVSVDGGAINNEPYGEVLAVLKDRYGKRKGEQPHPYALIMIDPFPDLLPPADYQQPDDLFSVVPAIIGSLWDQAKVKRAELLDAYSNDYYRGQIFPIRRDDRQNEVEPIACGAAMAFAGFLDISFRQHDFFLGRDNARNFFRTYFSFPYNTVLKKGHPIHDNWTPEMVGLFQRPSTEPDTVLLPIIPDLHILREKMAEGRERNPFERTVKEWPRFNPESLFDLREKMTDRISLMLEISYKKATRADKTEQFPIAEAWMKHYEKSSVLSRVLAWIGSGVLRWLLRTNRKKIARRIANAAIVWILKDLEANKLLQPIGDSMYNRRSQEEHK